MYINLANQNKSFKLNKIDLDTCALSLSINFKVYLESPLFSLDLQHLKHGIKFPMLCYLKIKNSLIVGLKILIKFGLVRSNQKHGNKNLGNGKQSHFRFN